MRRLFSYDKNNGFPLRLGVAYQGTEPKRVVTAAFLRMSFPSGYFRYSLSRRQNMMIWRGRTPGFSILWLLCFVLLMTWSANLAGQGTARQVKKPRVFLDKSPRIVAYQLKRLSDEQILLVDRDDQDAKYIPVHQSILIRESVSRADRIASWNALAKLQNVPSVEVLLVALGSLTEKEDPNGRVADQLRGVLLSMPTEALQKQSPALEELASEGDSSMVRTSAIAALLTSESSSEVLASFAAGKSAYPEDKVRDFLGAIPLVPRRAIRNQQRDSVVSIFQTARKAPEVRADCLLALTSIPKEAANTFQLASPLAAVKNNLIRDAAVTCLASVPKLDRDPALVADLVDRMVTFAEAVPAAKRTTDSFLDAAQLCDACIAQLPSQQAQEYRQRLRAISVRVVKIHTVEEEMRYDVPYFAVQAGEEVQIILDNEDLMPHNLVICQPETLRQVAADGMSVGPTGGKTGKQYVPDQNVLAATNMVPAHEREQLTFRVPDEPGEYPYVCTFPQHWLRMYGVMLVVEDLDAWNQSPTEPKDPLGNNRQIVANWTLQDFPADELTAGLRGRSFEIGKRIFEEASCAGCHKMQGQGGAIGPELTDIFTKWKGSASEVLHEILDPSHRIDPKYSTYKVMDSFGNQFTGLIVEETDEAVTLISDPESKKEIKVLQDDIEVMKRSTVSLMPKALMDRFTRDEILELLAYLKGADQ